MKNFPRRGGPCQREEWHLPSRQKRGTGEETHFQFGPGWKGSCSRTASKPVSLGSHVSSHLVRGLSRCVTGRESEREYFQLQNLSARSACRSSLPHLYLAGPCFVTSRPGGSFSRRLKSDLEPIQEGKRKGDVAPGSPGELLPLALPWRTEGVPALWATKGRAKVNLTLTV